MALLRHRHLVIVPDASLAFLPFETLRGPDGRYVVDQHLVTYTPSLAVGELIHRRKPGRAARPLLAMGGALYDKGALEQAVSEKQSQALIAWEGRRRQARGLELDGTFASLGHASWSELPGSRREALALSELVPGARVLLGADVTEARVKQMSRAGELAKYRMLHFATHGIAFPEAPSLSSVVLSQTRGAREGEDGFLTMAR